MPFTREHQHSSRLTVLVLAVGVFLLDVVSKYVVETCMQLGQSIPVWPEVFHITYVKNTGAAFSLFQDYPEVLSTISLVLMGIFVMMVLKHRFASWLYTWGYGLVIGGAAGNVLDRWGKGAVTDFLDVTLIHYPIFNLADSFICIGVGLLLIAYVRDSRHPSGT